MDKLVGQTIVDFKISADRTQISFEFASGGHARYYTEGDCCSESWIEHIGGLNNLIGHKVLSFESVSLGEVAPTFQEHDQLYLVSIKTTLGDFYIEFRNSSNGFYGGSLEEFIGSKYEPKMDELDSLEKDF